MSTVNKWGYPDSANGLTFAQCVGLMCGANGTQAQRDACAIAGYAGAQACVDDICVENGYGCPTPAAAAIPSAPVPRVTTTQTGTGPAPATPAPVTRITPQTIVQPQPNITAALTPMPEVQTCGAWQELNQAISENPLIAVAALVGLYLMLKPKGRR